MTDVPMRRTSPNYTRVDIRQPNGLVDFRALFSATGVDPYIEQDEIFEIYTNTLCKVVKPHALPSFLTGANCRIMAYTAAVNLEASRFVKYTGTRSVTFPAAVGDANMGVTINKAVAGQRVYVMTSGCFIVQLAGPALVVGNPCTSDNDVEGGKATAIVPGNAFCSVPIEGSVTIDGVDYAVVNIGQIVPL